MRRRALLQLTEESFPGLFFYASLTESKYPDFVNEGDWGLYHEGSSIIQNGELFISSRNSSYGLVFGKRVPIDVNLTFSIFVTPQYALGFNDMHGYRTTNSQSNTGCRFAKHQNDNRNRFQTDGIGFDDVSFSLFAPNLTKTFISYTIIFNAPDYTFIVYVNGIKQGEWTFNEPLFSRSSLERFSIGTNASNNNCIGYFSHFSVFKQLSDKQVMQLYMNGGVPLNY